MTSIEKHKINLETPCLVLDMDALERNLRKMQASHKCLQEAVHIFRNLQAIVSTCTIFSASGTGTFDIDPAISEVSELQVGSYVCMDAEYLDIGSADDDTRFVSFDPALRLLTTVVSANHEGFVTVDAGLKALYKDGGKPQVITPDFSKLAYGPLIFEDAVNERTHG